MLPLLRVGAGLRARGHSVSLLTHVAFRRPAEEAGLEFAALDDEAQHARSVEDGPLVNTPPGVVEFLRRHYLPLVAGEYERIRERCRAADTIVVARDLFDIGARIAAEKLGVPLVWVFVAPGQLEGHGLRRELFGRVLAGDVDRVRGELGLAPVRDWDAWLSHPGRHVGLWPDWFAPPDPAWSADVVPAGFILDNEGERGDLPEELRSALDSGERPVLITGGSGTFAGAAFYAAAVEACRRTRRPAVLVTPYDELVPPSLPDSIRRFPHLPLGKLLPRVEAVIHHGGRGTMSAALAAAVPQVVLAWGADRPGNAMR
ncbi:MAG TPA: glycosyltransferase, partial [Thermoanaerobaculia bacterium]